MDDFLSGRSILATGFQLPDPDDPGATPALASTVPGSPPAASAGSAGGERKSEADLPHQHEDGGAKVEYRMQNGRVTHIRVTCSCGNITELHCEY
ncbi:MAG: hypothetical protein EA425_10980 [Puniceicoccaceae bacterium]|nr:MAG: hypothetical protein EA425_10980 [Puniceicoccaceae bacterium]